MFQVRTTRIALVYIGRPRFNRSFKILEGYRLSFFLYFIIVVRVRERNTQREREKNQLYTYYYSYILSLFLIHNPPLNPRKLTLSPKVCIFQITLLFFLGFSFVVECKLVCFVCVFLVLFGFIWCKILGKCIWVFLFFGGVIGFVEKIAFLLLKCKGVSLFGLYVLFAFVLASFG